MKSVNIFYINGNEVKSVLDHIHHELPSHAYNIIVPAWDLNFYPQKWAQQLEIFEEIWVTSKFVFDVMQNSVSRPVFHLSPPVQFNLLSLLGRKYFSLPESSYLFTLFLNLKSCIDRENPFAVLKAFEKVNNQRPQEDTRLVIKLNYPRDSEGNDKFQKLMKEIDQYHYQDRIIIIDKLLTGNEIKNLIRCCDCFISLHRSEEFGRGMAEAMYLGRPVIATGYSGNLDFMDSHNSCLVDYKLITKDEGTYPYARGQVWADAGIDHAAEYMLKLLDDHNTGRDLGQIARQYMRVHFNNKVIGLKYKERLDIILQRSLDSKCD